MIHPPPLRERSQPSLRALVASSTTLVLALCVSCTPGPSQTELCTPEAFPTAQQISVGPEKVSSATTAASPQELKREADAARLAKDYQMLLQQTGSEVARLSPEIRSAAKALSKQSFKSTDAALKTILAGTHRQPQNVLRDPMRHPAETLSFFGVTPKQHILEYGPGGGWYTEILAPLVAPKGKLLVTVTDPNGPADARSTYYGKRTMLFLHSLQEAYGAVSPHLANAQQQTTIPAESVDTVLVVRGLHGMVNNGVLDGWLKEFQRVLKPGGVLGVVQHRATAGADPLATSKQGYLPEAFVIQSLETAGFKLEARSEVNANPNDTHQHSEGVWTLPPTLRLGEQDKAKYLAIGESDRMTLRFVKPEATGKR